MIVVDPVTLVEIGSWSPPARKKITFGDTAGSIVAIVSDSTLTLLAVAKSSSLGSGRLSTPVLLQELRRVKLGSPVSSLAMRLVCNVEQGPTGEPRELYFRNVPRPLSPTMKTC